MKLPTLSVRPINKLYADFLKELQQNTNFSGEVDASYNARLTHATDNSVYQFLPQAVIFPKSSNDVQILLAQANISKYKEITFTAKGGGTSTNGQVLNYGFILDTSKYMNKILEINIDEGWVLVESGVVKDKLNEALREEGYFFSPELSTSNRATIGGMISTDASGAGSLAYGKTSDHILELDVVLANGKPFAMKSLPRENLLAIDGDPTTIVAKLTIDNQELIESKFPKLNRFLTGYDLRNVWNEDYSEFNLAKLIAGAEGTLAVVTEAKITITPLPKMRKLIVIVYKSFNNALEHAPLLVKASAIGVETIDSKVLNLAKQDIIWEDIKNLLPPVDTDDFGINMVEFAGDDVDDLVKNLENTLQNELTNQEQDNVLGFKTLSALFEINKIYAMRKKAVGLLGGAKGSRKPIAFAEDTAVPPENLAPYIKEFRAILDGYGLEYGMFGHVDAGVLHVRPSLDMCDPNDEILLKEISDKVAALTTKYGGLMWGEHGKGVRGEYAPSVFGPELHKVLQEIKTLFDPDNKLNPGKLFAPLGQELEFNINSVKRGSFDRTIKPTTREHFSDAMNCNGNGLCFNYSAYSPMCPSFKVSQNRIYSPKGRAGVMREWLRLLTEQGVDVDVLLKSPSENIVARIKNSLSKDDDFSHEVMDAMQTCLACKSCKGQCPVKVDVSRFRSDFFALYYKKYARPLKDYLVGGIENMLPIMASSPKLVNALSQNKLSTWVIKKAVGYVDAPALSSPNLRKLLQSHEAMSYNLDSIEKITEDKDKYVLIVQDPFNSYYDAKLIYALVDFIENIGFKPILLPFKPHGKPLHIKGFLDKFAKVAEQSASFLNRLAKLEIPMIGIDPALVLCYRDEYNDILGSKRGDFNVLIFNEWLLKVLDKLPELPASNVNYTWFSHCTESSVNPSTAHDWQKIFSHFGVSLDCANLGCCGMAGTFGHELGNYDVSKALFDLTWKDKIDALDKNSILISGYSCRSQVKRFADFRAKHPVEALLQIWLKHKEV